MYIKLTPEQKQARADARKELKKAMIDAYREKAEREQKPIKRIVINIEWKKSRTWGHNPHCTAKVEYQDGTHETSKTFTASGWGYDKESTVIADVFNTFLKYKLYEPRPTGKPYGVYTDKYKYFNGGIGTSCYYDISAWCGGKFDSLASGKTFDVYEYMNIN